MSKGNPLKDTRKKASRNAVTEDVARKAAEEPTKRLNANVPESLHRRVKIEATRRGVSITDFLVEALEAHLEE